MRRSWLTISRYYGFDTVAVSPEFAVYVFLKVILPRLSTTDKILRTASISS